jgi:hypothetical protein
MLYYSLGKTHAFHFFLLKDLPRIYTMCLPVDGASSKAPPASLQDLHTAREDVVAEVRKAPARRMDNVITHLHDAVSQLHMHATILQDVRQRYSKFYWQSKWQELGLAFTGASLTTILTVYASGMVPLEITGAILGTTILGTGGLIWYHGVQLQEWERQASTVEELSAAFQRTHARAVSEGDEYTAAMWQRVRDPIRMSLEQQPISQFSNISKSDLDGLKSIIETEIPTLRRETSPTHYGKE